jgi:hypothetical protein
VIGRAAGRPSKFSWAGPRWPALSGSARTSAAGELITAAAQRRDKAALEAARRAVEQVMDRHGAESQTPAADGPSARRPVHRGAPPDLSALPDLPQGRRRPRRGDPGTLLRRPRSSVGALRAAPENLDFPSGSAAPHASSPTQPLAAARSS